MVRNRGAAQPARPGGARASLAAAGGCWPAARGASPGTRLPRACAVRSSTASGTRGVWRSGVLRGSGTVRWWWRTRLSWDPRW